MREAIDTIYQYLIDDELYTSDDIQALINSVDLITPNTEEFTATSSYALDACTAVLGALRFIIEPNIDFVVEVATFSRDTVDMYVQIRDGFDSNDPAIEARIANDPLMIREKRRQHQLIKKLVTIDVDKITDTLIENLRSKEPTIDITPF